MMIIALSGLGGSGKTTVLKCLEKEMGSLQAIHYPDELILTPMAQKLIQRMKYLTQKPSRDSSHEALHIRCSSFVVLLKALFYLIDAWIVWMFKLRNKANGLVVCDRYAYDQIIYYYMSVRRHKKLILWLAQIIPPVDLIIHFDVPPEVASRRKYEWPLEYLTREVDSRHTVFKVIKVPKITIDATASSQVLCQALKELIYICQEASAIDLYTCILLALLDPEVGVRCPNLVSVLKIDLWITQFARRNRVAYALSRVRQDNAFIARYGEFSIKQCEKWQQTIAYLNKLSKQNDIPMLVIKDFLETEVPRLPSDVDICIRLQDYQRIREIFSIFGELKLVESYKIEWSGEGFLPVDFYIDGIHDSGLLMLREEFIWKGATRKGNLFYPSPEVQIALLIQHSINETALITLFDAIHVKILSSGGIDWESLYEEAKACGWECLLHLWLSVLNTLYTPLLKRPLVSIPRALLFNSNLSFPFRLPIKSIIYIWWKKIFRENSHILPVKLWAMVMITIKALRIWRVRYKGQVPFHNEE
jgi:thymidylate kinase